MISGVEGGIEDDTRILTSSERHEHRIDDADEMHR